MFEQQNCPDCVIQLAEIAIREAERDDPDLVCLSWLIGTNSFFEPTSNFLPFLFYFSPLFIQLHLLII